VKSNLTNLTGQTAKDDYVYKHTYWWMNVVKMIWKVGQRQIYIIQAAAKIEYTGYSRTKYNIEVNQENALQ